MGTYRQVRTTCQMVEPTLAVAGASTLLVATVYGYVGMRLLGKTSAASPSSIAMRFFSLWWLATALNQFFGSLLYLAAAFGSTDVSLQLTYVYLQRLLLAVSLVGLLYYLVYLQTGKGWLIPLIVVYGLYFVAQVFNLSVREAVGVESFGWRTDIQWATAEPPVFALISLIIIVPPIVGALMMLRVYRRVETPTRRFRVAMIGIGFALWWALAILAGQRATFDIGWLQALNRVVGIAVAVGILLAYEPLGWMRRRYHLEPYQARG